MPKFYIHQKPNYGHSKTIAEVDTEEEARRIVHKYRMTERDWFYHTVLPCDNWVTSEQDTNTTENNMMRRFTDISPFVGMGIAMIFGVVCNIAILVGVVALVDFFVTSATLFAAPKIVLFWCIGIVVVAGAGAVWRFISAFKD